MFSSIFMLALGFVIPFAGTASAAVDVRPDNSEIRVYLWECENECGTKIVTLTPYGYYLAAGPTKGKFQEDFYKRLLEQQKHVRNLFTRDPNIQCDKGSRRERNAHSFFCAETRTVLPHRLQDYKSNLFYIEP
jgi:hypothetical protein